MRTAFVLLSLVVFPNSLGSALSPEEVERIGSYEQFWGLADVPEQAEAEVQPQLENAIAEARSDFGGRGREVAGHFLSNTEYPPSNTAYFFVLRAIGDVDTALLLIEGLTARPQASSGPPDRDFSEIRVATEAVLRNEDLRGDSRVVSALVNAAAGAAKHPYSEAETFVWLLGKCRGTEARRALAEFATNPDPSLRATAIEALGELGAPAETQPSMAAVLAERLTSDPSAEARAQAATALGKLASQQAREQLRGAATAEQDPRVVDAIVNALEEVDALPADREVCRQLAGRCWDAGTAHPLFECWRAEVDQEAVIESAMTGPAVFRALALSALAPSPGPARPMGLILQPSQPPALRPPPSSGGRMMAGAVTPTQPPPSTAPTFDRNTRNRLLATAVEVLSNEVSAFPQNEKGISYTTAHLAREALWEISGHKMGLALRYSDMIVPVFTHYTMSGRYGASHHLWLKDRSAYAAYRRSGRLRQAGVLMIPALLLLAFRRTRWAAVPLLVAVLLWGVWTMFQDSVRELPPPPLQYLTVSCIGFLSAGCAAALATLLSQRIHGALLVIFSTLGGAALAFFICGWTRWNHYFPVGNEAWEMLFDPIISTVLASGAAFAFSFLHLAGRYFPVRRTDSA